MGLKRPQFLALLGALAVVVLLVVLPRTPSGKSAAAVKAPSPAEVKMAEAIALVQGQDPMRGIMMLRELVEQDSDNAEAHWHLGRFSIQSGQYEKTLDRLRKDRARAAGRCSDGWFYLGST